MAWDNPWSRPEASGSSTALTSDIPSRTSEILTLGESSQFQAENPLSCLWPENNGYYVKNPDGTVLAVLSDDMCHEFDLRFQHLEEAERAGTLTDEYAV
ncbi:hypothetical protein BDV59DRAFT_205006 [Aspergillus ambiguus]|uniref:uncharacterized protein n=1 Tax=Aspergillus ambiguus TaxID=176160 RepID=UPI003CCD8B5B